MIRPSETLQDLKAELAKPSTEPRLPRHIVEGWHELQVVRAKQLFRRRNIILVLEARVLRSTSPEFMPGDEVAYVVLCNYTGCSASPSPTAKKMLASMSLAVGSLVFRDIAQLAMRRAHWFSQGYVDVSHDSEVALDLVIYVDVMPRQTKSASIVFVPTWMPASSVAP